MGSTKTSSVVGSREYCTGELPVLKTAGDIEPAASLESGCSCAPSASVPESLPKRVNVGSALREVVVSVEVEVPVGVVITVGDVVRLVSVLVGLGVEVLVAVEDVLMETAGTLVTKVTLEFPGARVVPTCSWYEPSSRGAS